MAGAPPPAAARSAAATVPVEVVSWVTTFVGGDGSGRRVFDEPLGPGATVRSVLRGLTARFPELSRALWNGDALGEHIEVLVNDAVLDVHLSLDSPLRSGDRIALLGQYMGG
jgi:molybdopterin converting factor small subunit